MLGWPRLVALGTKRIGEDDMRAREAGMPNCGQAVKPSPTAYATSEDFCRVFHQDMDRLYLLSWLLTADHQAAERCFVHSLEDCVESAQVFQEWARPWARRSIIHNSIESNAPTPKNPNPISNSTQHTGLVSIPDEIAQILALPAFERFVFVLSVLENDTDQECSLLLGCTRREVRVARGRAFEHLANLDPERNQLEAPDSAEARRDDTAPLLDRGAKVLKAQL